MCKEHIYICRTYIQNIYIWNIYIERVSQQLQIVYFSSAHGMLTK